MNKLKEEFMHRYEGANTVQSSISSFMANDIWKWIQSKQQEKIERVKELEINSYDFGKNYLAAISDVLLILEEE